MTLGATTLRVRLAGDVLAPEQRFIDLHKYERRHAVTLVALILLAVAVEGLRAVADHRAGHARLGAGLELPVGAGRRWSSGAPRGRSARCCSSTASRSGPHLRVALTWLLVGVLAEAVAAQLAFALSLPSIEKFGRIVFVAAIAMMMWRHMGLLLPQRRRAFAIAIGSAVAVGGGLLLVDRSLQQAAAGRRPLPRHDLAAGRARGQAGVGRRLREVGGAAGEDACRTGPSRATTMTTNRAATRTEQPTRPG